MCPNSVRILIVIAVLFDFSTVPLCTMPKYKPIPTAIASSQSERPKTSSDPPIVVADDSELVSGHTAPSVPEHAIPSQPPTATTVVSEIVTQSPVVTMLSTTTEVTAKKPVVMTTMSSITMVSIGKLPQMVTSSAVPPFERLPHKITTATVAHPSLSPPALLPQSEPPSEPKPPIVSSPGQGAFEILKYPHQDKIYKYAEKAYQIPVYGRFHGIWTAKVKPTVVSATSHTQLGSVQIHLPQPGFSRPCKTYFDCAFRPAKNMSRTWLKCEKNNFCGCELLGYFKDEDADWNLKWSAKAEMCLVDDDGPCGRNKGLELHCKRGHKCVGHVCQRSGKRLKTTTTTTEAPSSESCEDCTDAGEESGSSTKPANVFSLLFLPGLNFFKQVLNDSLSRI